MRKNREREKGGKNSEKREKISEKRKRKRNKHLAAPSIYHSPTDAAGHHPNLMLNLYRKANKQSPQIGAYLRTQITNLSKNETK